MKISYIHKNFTAASLEIIRVANEIITEYQADGYDLTLRQLYYQFVARTILPNTERSYNRLKGIVSNGRLAGLIDWLAIVDRTRNLAWGENGSKTPGHWEHPSEIIETAAKNFAVDKWAGQENRVEVWIEKEALAGVLSRVCPDLDVAYFSCRGYVSQSEQWRAARRLSAYSREDSAIPHIIHLGDHDPSGIDMTRDIEDRMALFGCPLVVHRIALNMDQVEKYNPPPNPAKLTDSRIEGYLERFGDQSWELDALEPRLLGAMIETEVKALRDEDLWNERVAYEEEQRAILEKLAEHFDEVSDYIRGLED